MHIPLRPCTTFSRGRTPLPGTVSSTEKLFLRRRMELKADQKDWLLQNYKGKNKVQEYSFFSFSFLRVILFAGEGQFSWQPLSPTISCVSVSCKTGFTAQHSGLLHLFSCSCTKISSVLPVQDVPFHVPPGETTVSVFVVCADNHRGTLAGKSCPEREWHLTLKVLRPSIPNGILF